MLAGVRAGAVVGAGVGSVFPGAGTAAVAVVGGVAGGVVAYLLWKALTNEEADAESITPTNPDGSKKELGQQREEIEKAQQKDRAKIERINKSRQRGRQEDLEEAERALEEQRRARQQQSQQQQQQQSQQQRPPGGP